MSKRAAALSDFQDVEPLSVSEMLALEQPLAPDPDDTDERRQAIIVVQAEMDSLDEMFRSVGVDDVFDLLRNSPTCSRWKQVRQADCARPGGLRFRRRLHSKHATTGQRERQGQEQGQLPCLE